MPSDATPLFLQARHAFHEQAAANLIRLSRQTKSDKEKGIPPGVPSFADKHSVTSREIGMLLIKKLGHMHQSGGQAGQTSGKDFEQLVQEYLQECFLRLSHMRPGKWGLARNRDIASYDQYAHLRLLDDAARDHPGLAAILGSDYTIKPDVVVFRGLEPDETINRNDVLVGDQVSNLASIRASNGDSSMLHASISCKYSIRSDRSQNSRSEALNLIRNRKGRAPHIVVVTCEPMPSRIGSIALGTGDIDCVYHFALPELVESVTELGFEDALDSLKIMIEGKRLRDIGDLPLDLAV